MEPTACPETDRRVAETAFILIDLFDPDNGCFVESVNGPVRFAPSSDWNDAIEALESIVDVVGDTFQISRVYLKLAETPSIRCEIFDGKGSSIAIGVNDFGPLAICEAILTFEESV